MGEAVGRAVGEAVGCLLVQLEPLPLQTPHASTATAPDGLAAQRLGTRSARRADRARHSATGFKKKLNEKTFNFLPALYLVLMPHSRAIVGGDVQN